MDATIIQAIRERQVLQFNYRGKPRVVEPHTYGINTAGHESLSCYQVSGESSTGSNRDWKTLLIGEISALTTTGDSFAGPRTGYVPNSKTFAQIFAQL